MSVSRAAGEEASCPGASGPTRPLYEHHDQAKLDHWAADTRRGSEAGSHGEESPARSESRRRADEELSALGAEEISARLDRTRREFYNRRKIIIKNLPADVSNQVRPEQGRLMAVASIRVSALHGASDGS